MSEKEMIIQTHPTHIFQVFWEFVYNFIVIFKPIIESEHNIKGMLNWRQWVKDMIIVRQLRDGAWTLSLPMTL